MFDATSTLAQADVDALKKLLGDMEQLDLEEGTFEGSEDPQAIGSVILTVRSYRFRC